MIYLASPYSHPDELMRKTRFLLAEECCAALLRNHQWTYSPIVHCHEMALRHNLPTDFAFWKSYNFAMLTKCDQFYILDIPGWRESLGVQGELQFASQFLPSYTLINMHPSTPDFNQTYSLKYVEFPNAAN